MHTGPPLHRHSARYSPGEQSHDSKILNLKNKLFKSIIYFFHYLDSESSFLKNAFFKSWKPFRPQLLVAAAPTYVVGCPWARGNARYRLDPAAFEFVTVAQSTLVWQLACFLMSESSTGTGGSFASLAWLSEALKASQSTGGRQSPEVVMVDFRL